MAYRILVVITLIGLTLYYSVYQKDSLNSQLAPTGKGESVLKALPQTEFATLQGEKVVLEDFYSKMKPELLVIHFWGTWCGPCERELPELLDLIKRYSERPGVHFFLVAVNDEVLKINKHLKTLKDAQNPQIHWLLDNESIHREVFGTTRVPETYVFSSDKAMFRKFVGPQDWTKPQYLQTFDEFIQISQGRL
jgi:cytochrome c biogenesis protein CcmG, thiol:disulfide interchange protein DsbE